MEEIEPREPCPNSFRTWDILVLLNIVANYARSIPISSVVRGMENYLAYCIVGVVLGKLKTVNKSCAGTGDPRRL